VSLESKFKYGLINVANVVASVATPILADERDQMTLEELTAPAPQAVRILDQAT
tara:strand:- start:1362 stop:1523 length:162 start_codon:yes stop_codon:yes gene_type:complete